MRNDRDFNLFYKTVKMSLTTIKDISTSTVPRKRRHTSYSILISCLFIYLFIYLSKFLFTASINDSQS